MKSFGYGYKAFLMAVVVMLLATGCFFSRQVEEYEVGLIMPDGSQIGQVVGAGRYTNMSPYAQLKKMDVSAQTFVWEDPDLATQDKQPVGVSIGVTYRRASGDEDAKQLWRNYNREARDNEALAQQVRNRLSRSAKEVTAMYTLNEMLGVADTDAGRGALASKLFEVLEPELAEAHIVLLDVGFNNIAPSQEYLRLLEDKANAQIAVEVAEQQTTLRQEQLNQERAQTDIDLEIARRENLVNQELAKTYEQSPQYYELERLRLLRGIIGERDKIYFIPAGADISLWLAGDTSAPPINAVTEPAPIPQPTEVVSPTTGQGE